MAKSEKSKKALDICSKYGKCKTPELKGYQKSISEAVGITDPKIVAEIEDIMRNDIFHSTLDWQTKEQFDKGAKQALELYNLLKTTEKAYQELTEEDKKYISGMAGLNSHGSEIANKYKLNYKDFADYVKMQYPFRKDYPDFHMNNGGKIMNETDKEKIKEIIKSTPFMSLRKPLEAAGFKVDVSMNDMPMPPIVFYVKKGDSRVAILNKSYVTDAEFVHGETAMGEMKHGGTFAGGGGVGKKLNWRLGKEKAGKKYYYGYNNGVIYSTEEKNIDPDGLKIRDMGLVFPINKDHFFDDKSRLAFIQEMQEIFPELTNVEVLNAIEKTGDEFGRGGEVDELIDKWRFRKEYEILSTSEAKKKVDDGEVVMALDLSNGENYLVEYTEDIDEKYSNNFAFGIEKFAKGGGVGEELEYKVIFVNQDTGRKHKVSVLATSKEDAENSAIQESNMGKDWVIESVNQMADGGGVTPKITIKPKHAHRDEVKELLRHLKSEGFIYRDEPAPNMELPHIVVGLEGKTEEEITDLTNYLDGQSWDFSDTGIKRSGCGCGHFGDGGGVQLYDVFALNDKTFKYELINEGRGGLTKKHAENIVKAINEGSGKNFTKGYSNALMDKQGRRSVFAKGGELGNGGGVGEKYEIEEQTDGTYLIVNKLTNYYVDHVFESRKDAEGWKDMKEREMRLFGFEVNHFGKGGGVQISNVRAREIANSWHGGQWSALYQFGSSGVYLAGNHLLYLKEVQERLEPEYLLHPVTRTKKDEAELNSLKRWFEYKGKEIGINTEWEKHPDYGYQVPFVYFDKGAEKQNIKPLKLLAADGGQIQALNLKGNVLSIEKEEKKDYSLVYYCYPLAGSVLSEGTKERMIEIANQIAKDYDNIIVDGEVIKRAEKYCGGGSMAEGGSMARGGKIFIPDNVKRFGDKRKYAELEERIKFLRNRLEFLYDNMGGGVGQQTQNMQLVEKEISELSKEQSKIFKDALYKQLTTANPPTDEKGKELYNELKALIEKRKSGDETVKDSKLNELINQLEKNHNMTFDFGGNIFAKGGGSTVEYDTKSSWHGDDVLFKDEGDYFVISSLNDKGKKWMESQGYKEGKALSKEQTFFAQNLAESMGVKVEEFGKGGGVGMQKIKVRDIGTNAIKEWTISELLQRINEDNASDEFNYNESDWLEGFNETLEGEFYSLNDKDGNPLNDLSKFGRGGGVGSGYLSSHGLSFDKVDYHVNVNPKNLEVDVNIDEADSVNQRALNDTDAEWNQHHWGYMVYPKTEEQLYNVLKALRVRVSKERLHNWIKGERYAGGGNVGTTYWITKTPLGSDIGETVFKTTTFNKAEIQKNFDEEAKNLKVGEMLEYGKTDKKYFYPSMLMVEMTDNGLKNFITDRKYNTKFEKGGNVEITEVYVMPTGDGFKNYGDSLKKWGIPESNYLDHPMTYTLNPVDALSAAYTQIILRKTDIDEYPKHRNKVRARKSINGKYFYYIAHEDIAFKTRPNYAESDLMAGYEVKGRGWGNYEKGKRITDIKELKVGGYYLDYSTQFNAKNIIKITSGDRTSLQRDIVYASHVKNPNDLNVTENDEFAIWGHDLDSMTELYEIKK